VSRTQLASIIVANILFLFGAVMDIFQLTSVTGDYSKYFQIRTAAAFYPFSGNKNIAQKQIVVVTIDEDFLQQEDERWPMPLETHGKLLETLFRFKPQAIFYDIEFDRTL
jgi:CHASE2 domain-containing sensor protein